MDFRYWFPAARLQLMLMGSLLTLVLKARQDLLDVIMDAPDGPSASSILRDTYSSVNRTLTLDTIEVMRWGLGELGGIMQDLGIREHNQAFAPVAKRLDMGYGVQTEEDVANAFSNRRQYLPNLTDTIWGQSQKRERMLSTLVDVVDNTDNVGAMDIAGALERMWEPKQAGARWAWTRMHVLSPKGRQTSGLGLLPPGSARGVSYNHLRVARTEVAGLQQEMAKQRYMAQPWVEGVDWTLSPGHPVIDICDDYADRNPWKKENVPAIPHPNCLCVLTPVLMDEERFVNRAEAWVSGEDDFLDEYADWLGDRAFMEHYPIKDTGKLAQWSGSAKNLPKAPNDLMALSSVSKWNPTIDVSDRAASVWDKVKTQVAVATRESRNVPSPVPLHALSADDALAYLRNNPNAKNAIQLEETVKNLAKKHQDLGDQIVDTLKPSKTVSIVERHAKAKELRALKREVLEEWTTQSRAWEQSLLTLREEVLSPEPLSNVNVTRSISKDLTPAERALAESKVNQGIRDVQRMVPVQNVDEGRLVGASKETPRAYQVRRGGQSQLHTNIDDPVSTHIHEWGHMIEETDRNKMERSVRFLQRRTMDDKAMVDMKSLPGYGYFPDEEYSMIDKFVNPYTGKIYTGTDGIEISMPQVSPWGGTVRLNATEVTSTGLEQMWVNAAKFANEDEDFFRFVWTEIMER